jgi:hypothetical protein
MSQDKKGNIMASPSVTYTFANSTTADATQVNQNFTDLIAGLTDGTKDLSISALTCAGNVTFNGNTTLGNASGDDIIFTGSLASSIPIKTTNTYDIGSADIGLRYIYLASSAGGLSTSRIGASSTASDLTYTLPATGGTLGLQQDAPDDLINVSLAASVSSNALTIALKTKAGTDPSATDVVKISFRNSAAATGTYTQQSVSSALSLVISSGSTLGHASGVDSYIFVYAVDSGSGVVLGASTTAYDQGTVITTVAEGGAGAADLNSRIYTASAQTSKPIRLIGRIKVNQATAGTWATIPAEVSLWPFKIPRIKSLYKTDAGQSISNATTTIVDFGTVVSSPQNCVTTGASWKFTSPKTTTYSVKAKITFNTSSTSYRDVYLYKNGSKVESAEIQPANASGGLLFTVYLVTDIDLAIDDYIDIRVEQNSGGALALSTSAGFNVVSISELEN